MNRRNSFQQYVILGKQQSSSQMLGFCMFRRLCPSTYLYKEIIHVAYLYILSELHRKNWYTKLCLHEKMSKVVLLQGMMYMMVRRCPESNVSKNVIPRHDVLRVQELHSDSFTQIAHSMQVAEHQYAYLTNNNCKYTNNQPK